MRIAHLSPTSGLAGNMLLGACLDAGCPWEAIAAALDPLPLGPWEAIREPALRGQMRGTYFDVRVEDPLYQPQQPAAKVSHRGQSLVAGADHSGGHRLYPDVVAIVEQAAHLPQRVRVLALEALRRIGEAEARLHGIPLSALHLHEIGALDTIVDVVGVCTAFHTLGIERVYCDPVHTGAGSLRTAHGLVPLPAPATLAILEDHPVIAERIGHELTTPTGAALLMTLLDAGGTRHQRPPAYRARQVGYGAGTADFPDRPNLLRLTIGETLEAALPLGDPRWQHDRIVQATANLDDVSPERIPPLVQALLAAGALDVTTTATIMKGGRPGVIFQFLAPPANTAACIALCFERGLTLGMRVETLDRVLLRREVVPNAQGQGVKTGYLGEQAVWRKPEVREGSPAALPEGDAAIPEGNEYAEFDNVEYILALLKEGE